MVFSKDIPALVKNWLRPNVEGFLDQHGVKLGGINHFVAHPGGKKVIEAYREALGMDESMTSEALKVLKEYGNMSSATILYVLKEFMDKGCSRGYWFGDRAWSRVQFGIIIDEVGMSAVFLSVLFSVDHSTDCGSCDSEIK